MEETHQGSGGTWQGKHRAPGLQEWKWLVIGGRREACAKARKALGVKGHEAWKNPEKTHAARASKHARAQKCKALSG